MTFLSVFEMAHFVMRSDFYYNRIDLCTENLLSCIYTHNFYFVITSFLILFSVSSNLQQNIMLVVKCRSNKITYFGEQ
jgi:hypothetical protein